MLAKAVIPYFEELIARWEQYLIIVDSISLYKYFFIADFIG